jgi:hypothetical protein
LGRGALISGEIQWNAFVEVGGITGAQEDAPNADMPGDTSVMTMAEELLTETGKAKAKAVIEESFKTWS